jgi:hypothetical protein
MKMDTESSSSAPTCIDYEMSGNQNVADERHESDSSVLHCVASARAKVKLEESDTASPEIKRSAAKPSTMLSNSALKMIKSSILGDTVSSMSVQIKPVALTRAISQVSTMQSPKAKIDEIVNKLHGQEKQRKQFEESAASVPLAPPKVVSIVKQRLSGANNLNGISNTL